MPRFGATMIGRLIQAGRRVSVIARRHISSTSAVSTSVLAVSLLLPTVLHEPDGGAASQRVHVAAAGLYVVAAVLAAVALVRTIRQRASMSPAERVIGIVPAVLVTVAFVLFATFVTGAIRDVWSWV